MPANAIAGNTVLLVFGIVDVAISIIKYAKWAIGKMPPAQSRAKSWAFTLNNYTAEDIERLKALGPDVDYLIAGKEVGENGTPHLQGYVAFRARKRFTQAKALIGDSAHLEVARNPNAAIEYCKKDGDIFEVGTPSGGAGSRSDIDAFKDDVKAGNLDLPTIREIHSECYAKYTRFCLEYIQDHLPKKVIELHPLHPWQEELNASLNREADDRTIQFIVDLTGNNGKSWFAHYYASNHEKVQVLQPGRKVDMAYALDPTVRVLFVDAPRSKQGEFLQYDFLEQVKDGYVFSSKYESRVKTLSKCHVVVMMNEEPDMLKLSADRYEITRI
mgnify:CR=1 FL=1